MTKELQSLSEADPTSIEYLVVGRGQSWQDGLFHPSCKMLDHFADRSATLHAIIARIKARESLQVDMVPRYACFFLKLSRCCALCALSLAPIALRKAPELPIALEHQQKI